MSAFSVDAKATHSVNNFISPSTHAYFPLNHGGVAVRALRSFASERLVVFVNVSRACAAVTSDVSARTRAHRPRHFLIPKVVRDLAAACGKLVHDLLVQPDVH
jgi:hypothetical protein